MELIPSQVLQRASMVPVKGPPSQLLDSVSANSNFDIRFDNPFDDIIGRDEQERGSPRPVAQLEPVNQERDANADRNVPDFESYNSEQEQE